MSDGIGLAVIGPGAIAEAHLTAFGRLGGVVPLWAVGRSATRTRSFADRWGIPQSGTTIDDMLGEPAVTTVLICSPNELHARQARACMEAGKDVILEIPIAMSEADATAIVRLAESLGRRLLACHTMRSFAGIRHMRALIASGEESISLVQGTFAIPRRNNEGFSGTRTWVDNLLWHHACHLVDASLWVASAQEVSEPMLLSGAAHPEFGMTMDLALAFAMTAPASGDRLIASHALTYNASALTWQLRFAGRHGDYVFDTGRLYGTDQELIVDGGSIRDLLAQNEQILHGLRTGEPTDFDARGVLPAMRALERLQNASPVR